MEPLPSNIFSSSPAFGTPAHPILPANTSRIAPPAFKPAAPSHTTAPILPVLLSQQNLRPTAVRTLKKHNLSLTGPALQSLALFVGRHCGSGWREEGTAEQAIEEVAKLWKNENGGFLLEEGEKLKGILKVLESCMSGGRVGVVKAGQGMRRESSFAFGNDSAVDLGGRPALESQKSFGISALSVEDEEGEGEDGAGDPRAWVKTISAFEMPRLGYEVEAKHFVAAKSKASMFPSPSEKIAVFRDRYNTIHQRLLRSEAFQVPSFSVRAPALTRSDTTTAQQFYKLTPIANLLGRGGTQHLLLGMLGVAPTGGLAFHDLSGSISLDLQYAQPMQGQDSAYFCPGMIVLIEGQYEENWAGAGSSGLGNTGGVGGTIGGRFLGFSIGGPPVERRNVSLGVDLKAGDPGGGFGWTDFLGLGSDRAVGERMRRLEKRLLDPASPSCVGEGRRKMVVLGEVTLDQPATLAALRKVLQFYDSADAEPPMSFVLTGNFSSRAAMANAGTGSVEYKELFDSLAAILSDFPRLLRSSTWTFIPGDNDPWASSFSAGASALIPREGIPDFFTNRIRRAFAAAKAEVSLGSKKESVDGEAVWTSNPARVSLFGPAHEVVVFRDDLASRFRRTTIRVGEATKTRTDTTVEIEVDMPDAAAATIEGADSQDAAMSDTQPSAPTDPPSLIAAKKLILSLLPQSTLSPFPMAIRPTHWSYTSALSLYPLPHTLVLVDAESEPFALTFEGCHVLNPGRLVTGSGRRKVVKWGEYDCWTRRGVIQEDFVG
ncbi:hypothetical protein B0A48_03413 [Cryoendolithus antarcticus]|uniref:DNA polymerase epsilon subunit B n=1 Tax=Cryoendolithus antarcticus TaxID=1507870 RepID=A0A1V8TJY3_9PEZI|nr:hypothetical protein B0A48_03413 [Cryoendolithus antarcticus]